MQPSTLFNLITVWDKNRYAALSTCVRSVPDELVVVEEGCVFDQTEALFHSVNKRLDLQVGHLIQREEADPSKHIQQVRGLQMESLQILKHK